MKRFSAIVVDDEQQAVDQLVDDLQRRDVEAVCATTDPAVAIDALVEHKPDLLFLDIEMPGMNGLEMLNNLYVNHLMPQQTRVVFYTAFDKYMIDAIRSSAFDYLLKPYKESEFDAILTRLTIEAEGDSIRNELRACEQSVNRLLSNERRFIIQGLTGLLILHHSQIVFFTYVDTLRSWQVMLTDKSVHRLRTAIKSADILDLNSNFLQISSDTIVNIEYLSSIENHSMSCRFFPPFNDIELSVSRRFYKALQSKFDKL